MLLSFLPPAFSSSGSLYCWRIIRSGNKSGFLQGKEKEGGGLLFPRKLFAALSRNYARDSSSPQRQLNEKLCWGRESHVTEFWCGIISRLSKRVFSHGYIFHVLCAPFAKSKQQRFVTRFKKILCISPRRAECE